LTLLLVVGNPSLQDRVRKAAPERYDVRRAGRLDAARRILDSAAAPSLLVGASASLGIMDSLVGGSPDLRMIVLTTDRAMAQSLRGRSLGAIAALLPANASRAILRRSIEAALKAPAHGPARYGTNPDAAQAVRDADTRWPASGGGPSLHLKTDWLRVVSHDLRTPLGINNGFVTLLLESQQQLPPEMRDVLERLLRSGEWMLQFVDGMLELAALEHDQPSLTRAPVDAGALLAEVVERMQGLAQPVGVHLTMRDRTPVPPFPLDRLRIEQVLQNLLANAISASPRNGTVTASAERQGDSLTFRIRDEGPGLSAKEAAQVFRLQPSSASGRGLGLAICQAIVALHGGRIWVESRPRHGSTFAFTVAPG